MSPRVDTKKRKGPKINVKSMLANEPDKSQASQSKFAEKKYMYEVFFNDNMADVSDKVKDLLEQYRKTKADLSKEYKDMEDDKKTTT